MFRVYSNNLFDALEAANQDLKLILRYPEQKLSKTVEDNTFICPLCQGAFHLYDISDDPNEIGLTLEHVPPDVFGWQVETMTCAKCNNNQGSLEGKTEEHFRKKHMWEKEGKTKGRISFADREEEIAVEANLKGDRADYRIINDEERTNPNAISEFFEHLKEKGEYTVHLEIYTGLTRKQRAILYKSAYLIMFYVFGYPYILGTSTDPIEEQINHADQEIIPDIGVISMNGVPEEYNPPTISWLIEPIKAHFVVLPMEVDNTKKHYGLILPGPEDDPDVFIDKLEDLSSESLQTNSTFNGVYNVPKRNTLVLTDHFGVATTHSLWDRYTN